MDVAIVGGGYCAALTAAHLLRHPRAAGLRVALVHEAPYPGRGLAYGTWDDNLLLNVPAGNMSAWDEAPLHFVHHLQGIDPSLHEGSFVARRLYGDYLEQQLQAAASDTAAAFQKLPQRATAVRALPDGGYRIELASGTVLDAKRVVLALGHLPPRWPGPLRDVAVRESGFLQPGDHAGLQALPADAPVLVLGSGLTAIDLVFQLTRHAPRRVLMLSRHGLLPLGHRSTPKRPQATPAPALLADRPLTARGLLRGLRHAAKQRQAAGGDWRDAVNELRAHTPTLWQGLPPRERARFVTHLATYWDVHRHRLAPVAAHRLQALRDAGQVEVLAGRVCEARPTAKGVQLAFHPRGSTTARTLDVAAIVNATGPGAYLGESSDPLLRQLVADGLVVPDPLGLGLYVGPGHALVGARGEPQPHLLYVGPWLKATLWEATAVPELRQHTRQVAEALLHSLQV